MLKRLRKMKKSTKTRPPLRQGAPADFQTPPYAILPLLPYLKEGSTIWECAAGSGNLVNAFMDFEFNVIATDILTGQDFLKGKPKKPFDYIITNPPYNLKQEFLTRAYQLEVPFALLLPLTTFETRKRQALFDQFGVKVIFFDKRIKFETPTGRKGDDSSPWFATAWFTWGIDLPKELNFRRLDALKEDWKALWELP
jgi:hypothetical protein